MRSKDQFWSTKKALFPGPYLVHIEKLKFNLWCILKNALRTIKLLSNTNRLSERYVVDIRYSWVISIWGP